MALGITKPTVGASSGTWGGTLNTALDQIVAAVNQQSLVVNVKAFGATGDGTTDDTAAIQAAINSVPHAYGAGLAGATVYFPPGHYKVTSTLDISLGHNLLGTSPVGGVEWALDAPGSVLLAATDGMTLLRCDGTSAFGVLQDGGVVEGLRFVDITAGGNGQTATLVRFTNTNRWRLRDCTFSKAAVGVRGDSGPYGGGDCSWWVIDGCAFYKCATGYQGNTGSSGTIVGGDFTDCSQFGIHLDELGAPMRVLGVKMDVPAGAVGIYTLGYSSQFVACSFEQYANTTGIQIAANTAVYPSPPSGEGNAIIGCSFTSHGAAAVPWVIGTGCRSTNLLGNWPDGTMAAAQDLSGLSISPSGGGPTAPSDVGARTGLWDPRVSAYRFRFAALSRFLGAYAKANAGLGLCQIAVVGDSLSTGYPNNDLQWAWSSRLRNALEAAGAAVTGGWTAMFQGSDPGAHDPQWTTVGFTTTLSADGVASPYGRSTAAGTTATFVSATPGTVAEVLYGLGSGPFTVNLDGTTTTVTPAAGSGAAVWQATGLADTTHTITVTTTSATVTRIGAARVRHEAGVSVGNFGFIAQPAPQYADLGPNSATPAILATAPDLLIAELMMSDPQSESAADYKTALTGICNAYKGANHDVAFVAPNAGNNFSFAGYRTAMYDVADQFDVPVVDIYDRWGTFAHANGIGFMTDDYHPSEAGHADVGAAVAAAVLSVAAGTAVPTTGGSSSAGASPLVRAANTGTAQTIPAGTQTTLRLTAQTANEDGGLYSFSSGTNQVSVSQAGLYLATWSVQFGAGTAGSRETYLVVNGTVQAVASQGASLEVAVGTTYPVRLGAGAGVRIDCWSDNAAVALNVSDPALNFLQLVRIG